MESAKRKREADGAVGDRHEVTDEEVEEFYAILGRIRDATRCHSTTPSSNAVGGGGGGGVWWRPAFAWEDFAVRDDGAPPLKITAAEGEGEGESAAPRRIDLNADPEPEPEPEPKPKPEPEMGSPPGEVTAPPSSMRA